MGDDRLACIQVPRAYTQASTYGQHALWRTPRTLTLHLSPAPRAPDELVAVKSVDATRFRSIAEIEQIQEEMAVLSSLRHPNIIRLLDVHFQVYGGGGRRLLKILLALWPHSEGQKSGAKGQ